MPGAVLWEITGTGTPTLVLPDGCMDLLWRGGELLVAGPDAVAHRTDGGDAGDHYLGLRLPPGLLPSVLRVPAHELTGLRVPAADILDRRAMADLTRSGQDRGRAMERLCAEHARPTWAAATVRALACGVDVRSLASELGWSERTMRREFREHVGYGAKRLAMILRLQGAVGLSRAGAPLAVAAAAAGYADQAHLARDARLLTGTRMRELAHPGSGA